MNADIESLDADLKAQWAIIERAREEAHALRELRDEALDAHLATLTDEQIMGDEQLLRQVLREAWSHSGASRIVKRLYATDRTDLVAEGIDGRDEYAEHCLPALQVRLQYRQDVAEVAERMRSWAAVWALGRTDLVVDILEHDLSRWASWRLLWNLETGVCGVSRSSYGSPEQEGTLEEVLPYVAEQLWYEGGPDDGLRDYPY